MLLPPQFFENQSLTSLICKFESEWIAVYSPRYYQSNTMLKVESEWLLHKYCGNSIISHKFRLRKKLLDQPNTLFDRVIFLFALHATEVLLLLFIYMLENENKNYKKVVYEYIVHIFVGDCRHACNWKIRDKKLILYLKRKKNERMLEKERKEQQKWLYSYGNYTNISFSVCNVYYIYYLLLKKYK